MMPNNVSALRNEELIRFCADNTDPLVTELCRRLEGVDWQGEIHELEAKIESLEEENYSLETKVGNIEEAENRIIKLEDFLTQHKIEVPK